MDIYSSGFSSSDMLASVSTNVQDVLSSLAPIIELIVGVVLAFLVARYLVSLFQKPDVKNDLNSPLDDEYI